VLHGRVQFDDFFHAMGVNAGHFNNLQDTGGFLSPCKHLVTENQRIAKRIAFYKYATHGGIFIYG
jgi:hypothetical protein